MKSNPIKKISLLLFTVFVFVSGFLLAKNGRPYAMAFMAMHKISAIALTVFIAMAYYRPFKKKFKNNTSLQLIALSQFLVFLLISVFSGIMIGINNEPHRIILLIHKFGSFLAFFFGTMVFYLSYKHSKTGA